MKRKAEAGSPPPAKQPHLAKQAAKGPLTPKPSQTTAKKQVKVEIALIPYTAVPI